MVFMFQDVSSSSSGRTAAVSIAKVHGGSFNMEMELTAAKNTRITNFFRIHKQCSDNGYFLDLAKLEMPTMLSV